MTTNSTKSLQSMASLSAPKKLLMTPNRKLRLQRKDIKLFSQISLLGTTIDSKIETILKINDSRDEVDDSALILLSLPSGPIVSRSPIEESFHTFGITSKTGQHLYGGSYVFSAKQTVISEDNSDGDIGSHVFYTTKVLVALTVRPFVDICKCLEWLAFSADCNHIWIRCVAQICLPPNRGCVELNLPNLRKSKTTVLLIIGEQSLDSSIRSDDDYQELDLTDIFVCVIREELKQLLTQLEREPNTDIERHLMFEEFILSVDNINGLQSLHSELESYYKQNKDKRHQMVKTLESLWNRMNVQQTDRDNFFANKDGCKPSILAHFEEEISKYEEILRQNIGIFVSNARNELNEWSEKCLLSDQQKDRFRPLIESNDLSEELLNRLEYEVQNIHQYYDDCKHIFVKLEEWHDLWQSFKEVENRADDPNRYHNRGCPLISEEQQRNMISIKLAKVEQIIEKFDGERLKENRRPFEVNGLPFEQYWLQLKHEYQVSKKNQILQKQQLRQKELQCQQKGKKLGFNANYKPDRRQDAKRKFNPSSCCQYCGSTMNIDRVGTSTGTGIGQPKKKPFFLS